MTKDSMNLSPKIRFPSSSIKHKYFRMNSYLFFPAIFYRINKLKHGF
jgi:hypothetical protein